MFYRTLITAALAATANIHAATVSLTVEGAATRAASRNPTLAAARQRIEAARARLDAAGRLENPELEFEFRQNPRLPERSASLAWTQRFPITARLRLEKNISRAELAAAEAEVRDTARKLAGEARAAAIALLALEKEQTLRGRQMTNSAELTEFLKKRVASGEASPAEAAQIELETSQLAVESRQLDIERATLLGTLRPLLGLRSDDRITITGDLAEPGGKSFPATHPENRPDHRAAQAQAEAARVGIELARAQRWSDVGLGLLAEHERSEDAPDGFSRDTMLGFSLSVPLPIWKNDQARIREAEANARRAELEVTALAAEIRSEAATARAEMTALAGVLAEFDRTLLPKARQVEDQLQAAYTAGQTALPEVIRARGKRFELEAQRLEALRDWHLARAKHQTAAGGGK